VSIRRRAKMYRLLYYASIIATIIGVILGATPESWYEGKAITICTMIGPTWRVSLLIAAGSIILIQNVVTSHSVRTRTIYAVEKLLQKHHEDIFGGEKNDHTINRVTLFVYREHWWPWRIHVNRKAQATVGKLVPLMRYGQHVSHISPFTVFDPPSSQTRCHGIAGEAWLKGGTASSLNLDPISTHSTDHELSKYAQDTFVTLEFVKSRLKKNRPMSRSIYAVVVKANDENWGVLVVDSTEPAKFSRQTKNKVGKFAAEPLEAILSGGSQ